MLPSHPYCPFTPGDWTDYKLYLVNGIFHRQTLAITLMDLPQPDGSVKKGKIDYPKDPNGVAYINRITHLTVESAPRQIQVAWTNHAKPDITPETSHYYRQEAGWVGEAKGNHRAVKHAPALPLLPFDLTPGVVHHGSSEVDQWAVGDQFPWLLPFTPLESDFPWAYAVTQAGPFTPELPDCIVTSFLENPGRTGSEELYVHTWARPSGACKFHGLVSRIKCSIAADDTISGYEEWAINSSRHQSAS